ncbi:hypothetical protein [Aphanothece sacrum]|uniref:Uncharacterized protein n=1 Tax=Aphanothece sacrum FPU1 TaxID=1920663 RepID=A0A401IKN1_APHSA|nr:hypothetical protein [Aphanothece sacrum]GBF81721.1 hypothetical protein AsFPU1_3141 [Aphanothece sacrum FPU1]GBF85079.1 hypothetical protein AsFPU3_2136 [Aphanothece sacrum FPU3]
MILFWRRAFHLPQTYLLIIGAILGYISFIVVLGIRPFPIIIGGLIVLGMIGIWFQQLWQFQSNIRANLLEIDSFVNELNKIEQNLGHKSSLPEWQQVLKWAKESQIFAHRISTKESILTPDLLETLYSILGLLSQVVQAILALEQIQTETYRTLTKKHLQTSCNRLQETHHQLQHLHDQVVVSSLDTFTIKAGLPYHLRGIIADNQTVIETIIQDAAKGESV